MPGLGATRPLLRFHLAGIPVDVQAAFAIVMAGVALQGGDRVRAAVWIAVVTASVLWHELGHGLAMRRLGYPPDRLELTAFGGLTHWRPGAAPRAHEALLVAAAGPLAGLALGGACWALRRAAPPLAPVAATALDDLVYVNVAWSLFNLLPMLPLDGGHVLDHAARLRGAAEPRWVGGVSVVTGVGAMAWAVAQHRVWVAFLGLGGVVLGVGRLRAAGGWRGARDPVEADRVRARRAAARGDLPAAVSALFPHARTGHLPPAALAELVEAMVRLGRYDALVGLCKERLGAFARRPDAEPLARLAAEALADAGATEQALAVSQSAFRQLRVAWHAWDAALQLVRLERHAEAVEWLRRAVDAGLDCAGALVADPALDPLRDRDDFQEVVARASRASA